MLALDSKQIVGTPEVGRRSGVVDRKQALWKLLWGLPVEIGQFPETPLSGNLTTGAGLNASKNAADLLMRDWPGSFEERVTRGSLWLGPVQKNGDREICLFSDRIHQELLTVR